MSINVAIDGPAGAGKSTIARILADKLHYIYVDTGAMYRAIALYMITNEIDITDLSQVESALTMIDVAIGHEDGIQQVYLNGENVSGQIRTEQVSQMTSKVAVISQVRAKLLDLQRDFAKMHDVVMDGRDIGTFVLPDAQAKIYLTASSHVRAERRYKEHLAKNEPCDLVEIEREIIERDYRDMNRDIAPLKQADDAVLLDSSDLTIDQVVAQMEEIVLAAGGQTNA